MPASVLFGDTFEPVLDDNGAVRDVVPVNGAYEFVGRVKLQRAIELCEAHGIPSTIWPVYDVGVTAKVPLDLAITACKQLRPKLMNIREEEVIKDNAFLRMVISHVEEGRLFFIVM